VFADIPQGQGLKKDLSLNAAISQWRAYNCPEGTVGATEDTQGTATAVVCRAVSVYCGKGYVYSAYGNECRNPAGFGAYMKQLSVQLVRGQVMGECCWQLLAIGLLLWHF
jgi:hypothetical protein